METSEKVFIRKTIERSLTNLTPEDYNLVTQILKDKGVYDNLYKLFLNNKFTKRIEQNQR